MKTIPYALAISCFLISHGASAADDPAALAKVLSSGNAEARANAAVALGKLGPAAKGQVGALATAMSDKDAGVKVNAARALSNLGADAAGAVKALRTALADKEPMVRAYAAAALGRIGSASSPALPELVGAIADEESELVRRAAIRALRELKPDEKILMPLLAKSLKDASPVVRADALDMLAERGAAAVPLCIRALEDDKARYWALLVLAEIGPSAASAVPAVNKALLDKHPETRLQAALSLAAMGSAAKASMSALLAVLEKDDQNSAKYAAAYALGAIGANDAAAQAALRKAVDDKDKNLRMASAWSLAKLNPDNRDDLERAAKELVVGMTDPSSRVRSGAARALVQLNLPPEISQPVLVEALKSAGPETADYVIDALTPLGEKVVPRAAKALANPELTLYAARLLGRLGPLAKAAAPDLASSLATTKDKETIREIAFALGNLGPHAASAVPNLIRLLESDESAVQHAAVYALGRIGSAAEHATAPLTKLLSQDDEFQQVAAAWALVKIKPGDDATIEAATPLLIRALASEKNIVRYEAAIALGELGPKARSAISALTGLKNDPDEEIREVAGSALKRIGK